MWKSFSEISQVWKLLKDQFEYKIVHPTETAIQPELLVSNVCCVVFDLICNYPLTNVSRTQWIFNGCCLYAGKHVSVNHNEDIRCSLLADKMEIRLLMCSFFSLALPLEKLTGQIQKGKHKNTAYIPWYIWCAMPFAHKFIQNQKHKHRICFHGKHTVKPSYIYLVASTSKYIKCIHFTLVLLICRTFYSLNFPA